MKGVFKNGVQGNCEIFPFVLEAFDVIYDGGCRGGVYHITVGESVGIFCWDFYVFWLGCWWLCY